MMLGVYTALLADTEFSAVGEREEKSLAMYRDLALADVSAEYEAAMQSFPVR